MSWNCFGTLEANSLPNHSWKTSPNHSGMSCKMSKAVWWKRGEEGFCWGNFIRTTAHPEGWASRKNFQLLEVATHVEKLPGKLCVGSGKTTGGGIRNSWCGADYCFATKDYRVAFNSHTGRSWLSGPYVERRSGRCGFVGWLLLRISDRQHKAEHVIFHSVSNRRNGTEKLEKFLHEL